MENGARNGKQKAVMRMEAAAWGFIGTIVGAATSIATSWIAGKSAQRIQDAKALQEQVDRAHAFQRETILELQETVHDVARLRNRAHLEDLAAHKRGIDWGKNTLSDDVNNGSQLALRRLSILVERLADAPLRERVRTSTRLPGNSGRVCSEIDSETSTSKVVVNALQLIEALGTELRQHYPQLTLLSQSNPKL